MLRPLAGHTPPVDDEPTLQSDPQAAPAPKPPAGLRFDLSDLVSQGGGFYDDASEFEDSEGKDSEEPNGEEDADEAVDEEAARANYEKLIMAAADKVEAQIRADTPVELRLAGAYRERYGASTAFGQGEFRRKDIHGAWVALPEDTLRAELFQMADRSLRRPVHQRTLVAVLKLLRSALYVEDELWALDPGWLPCANGLLELATGSHVEYNQDQYTANPIPTEYDPYAYTHLWREFISATIPAEAQYFVQEFAGYALTAQTNFELALLLLGPPGSGKSTFLHGLELILGPRCVSMNLHQLGQGLFSPSLLRDTTLIISPEQASGPLPSPDRLNSLITGEAFHVQPPYHPPTRVRSRAKLACAFTSWPEVDNAQSGFFRRMAVVVLPDRPVEDRDPSLKDRLAKERAGMLNWAVMGLHRLLERGRFKLPPGVVAASRQLYLVNDPPAQFLADCCQRDPDLQTKAFKLYEAYVTWCRANGHRPNSAIIMARHWERLGLVRRRAAGGQNWHGALVDEATIQSFKKAPSPTHHTHALQPRAHPPETPQVPDAPNPPIPASPPNDGPPTGL